ncbi:hypothetical protein N1851_008023 [Merluccius polli]|uniref:Uncharacterized protein n=1 Tax=Merluccius polli TaxID=89951 RepID=A0AA47P7B8_MERPO|nr:hypothetical protein N1851_008023 [Merluccius polli]
MEEAHERKLKKYQALIFESQENGWKTWNLPVEVGFAGQSLWRVLGLLGIEEPARKRLVANITKQAEAASRWIWITWNEQWQSQPDAGRASNSHSFHISLTYPTYHNMVSSKYGK